MLTLRPYEPEDAKIITSWIPDETTMRRLSANLYDSFPVTAEMMNRAYENYRTTHHMQAFTVLNKQDQIVGHFTYLFRADDPGNARICFVITDTARRGQGIGTEMVRMAVRHAKNKLHADRITLCVFANNPIAHRCYRKVGFRDLESVRQVPIMGEIWDCVDMVYEGREETWN